MNEQFSRTKLLFGADNMNKLFSANVAVFGVGGVGGYVVEALVRSGVGKLELFDHDTICLSNINRQIYALQSTVGRDKVDVACERALDINPDVQIKGHKMFYLPETSGQVDLSHFDYVVDAIDTITGKVELAVQASSAGVPIISSMGAGNKFNISDFEVADIFDTSICPLAKAMRSQLRKNGIDRLKVVYSKEPATVNARPPGSNSFVPPAVGLIIAGEVIKELITR